MAGSPPKPPKHCPLLEGSGTASKALLSTSPGGMPHHQGAQPTSQQKLESIPELNEGLREKEQLHKGKEPGFWGIKVEKTIFRFLGTPGGTQEYSLGPEQG